jgi:hypothetical protein
MAPVRRIALTTVATLLIGAIGWTSVRAGQSASKTPVPVLVELFTSEGCSSCPPADQLLSELVSRQPVPGALVVGLSEHVDYWNHLGWKDPFSNALFSKRQSDYAATFKVEGIYTPQMVVDGRDAFVGSDRERAMAAIATAAAKPRSPVLLAWTSSAPPVLTISIDGGPAAAGATVRLAITEDGLASDVTRGENGGHRLTHAAVTRDLADIGRTDRTGRFSATRTLALGSGWRRTALHAIVFAQASGSGTIRAAGAIDLR